MLQASIYTRVSTDEQARGLSLDAQEAACREYITARGWALAHVYRDVDTGRHSLRPAFAELREHLADYDAVVCWKSDRISRRTLDALQFIEECSEAGVAFISTTQSFDVDDSIGQAAFTMAAALAQVESDHTSERVRAAVRRQLEQGRLPWRTAYGWDRNRGEPEINEEEGGIVRRIFAEYDDGRTHEAIAEGLRADRIKRRGRAWHRNSVGDILRNPAYIGAPLTGRLKRQGRRTVRRLRSEWTPIEGLLPPIISKQLWEATRRCGVRGRRPSRPTLLRLLLRCGQCGRPWHVRTRARINAYACSGHPECDVPQMREPIVLPLLDSAFAELMRPDSRASVQTRGTAQEGKRLKAAEQKCTRAWVAYVEGGVGIDVVRKAQIELGDAETAVQIGARPPLEGKPLRQAVATCGKALKLEDIDEANRRLRGIVARIVVRQEPARVEVVFWAT